MFQLDIHGDPPALGGQICEAILCEQFWHDGVLDAPANVTHLCFGGRWFRLYFDWGIIFWRPADASPAPCSVPAEGYDYPLVDVGAESGVVGARLVEYRMEPTERGSRVTFLFDNARRVVLEDTDDHTTYRLE